MSQQDPVTKEELKMMMEVQSKATEQMVVIAQRLQEIVLNQIAIKKDHENCASCHEKIIGRVTSGMVNDLQVIFDARSIDNQEAWESSKTLLESIKKDTGWQKMLFGLLAFSVSVGLLVSQFIHWIMHPGKP